MIDPSPIVDVAIVGAGAAGLATAIFTRRASPLRSVLLLDGSRKPGAKILVSGGGRCNVTNAVVTERDFWGGSTTAVRRILRAFGAADAVRFFAGIGIALHEEAEGKLFPDTNRARDVLDALLRETERCGAALRSGHRVLSIARDQDGFAIGTTAGLVRARTAVLAAGGQSLPRSGSDGSGYDIARSLGHRIVPTTPALVPLTLDDDAGWHRRLAGVSHPAEIAVWVDGAIATRLTGSLLWTHFGASGPVVLNASRHWCRAELERRAAALTIGFCPGLSFDAVEGIWSRHAAERPRTSLHTVLAGLVPASVASALLDRLAIDGATPLAHFSRADRRRLTHALTAWPLPVTGTRGYNYAEATAGGVALDEIDPSTLQSRICPGLYVVGEILDVDGRIGGFNFQWAWATAWIAGQALARREPL